MKTNPRLVLIGCLGALAAEACSSDSSAACGAVSACGGELKGTWVVDSNASCIESLSQAQTAEVQTFCPDARLDYSGVTLKGQVTFNADGSYAESLGFSGKLRLSFPTTCLMRQGQSIPCNRDLTVDAGAGSGFKSEQAALGECEFSAAPQTIASSGTFTSSKAGVLTQTADDGAKQQSAYCVTGTQLSLQPKASNGDDGKQGELALSAHLVLHKK